MGYSNRWFVCASCMTFSLFTISCPDDGRLSRLSTRTEAFVQNAAAKIDILWVVDNSNSMAVNQQDLGQSFESFINNLISTGVDYHIGVITTDPGDNGVLHSGNSSTRFITNETSDSSNTFLENVEVGIAGSAIERAFESTALALGVGAGWEAGDVPIPPNEDFLRPDASLFIIMVSDEDDKSFGPVGYFKRLFETYKSSGNDGLISISAIVGDEEEGCYQENGGSAFPGDRYIELAQETGGLVTSICSDFSQSLQELSIWASGLRSTFELSSLPRLTANIKCDGIDEDALESFCVKVDRATVEIGEEDSRDGWFYDENANAIVFGADAIPGIQADITVEYEEKPQ
jgi:hypothetical protein